MALRLFSFCLYPVACGHPSFAIGSIVAVSDGTSDCQDLAEICAAIGM